MINTPALSRYVVISRTSVSHIAFFIVSLFLLLPLLGIATSGVNDSPEGLESPTQLSYTHSSSSMNEPGFQEGSIFTRSTISGGLWDTCVILDNSSVNCWGLLTSTSNDVYGTNINLSGSAVSIAIANQLSGAITGSADRCAIMEDSTTVCWQKDHSQFSPYTQDFGIGRNAVSLSGSFQRMCAILDDASLKCWGTNTHGQIGDGTYTSRSNPTSVNLGDNRSAVSVAVGYHHTCAILDNASLKCWGWNDDGQIGDGTTVTRTTPVHVDLGIGRKAVAITAGFSHTCAILDNGSAMCWGQGQQGNLGNGGYSDSSTPTQVSLPSGRTAIAIAGGTDHTCAILDNASIVCWGHNIYGQTGVPGGGSNQVQTTPVAVDLGLGRHAVAITSGGSHSCAALDDASMKCWGQNSYGQLGTGDTTSSSTPASAALPTGRHIDLPERDIDGDGVLNIFDTHMKRPSAISVGTHHTCAVLDDDSLYCWGWNNNGQLGDGSFTDSTTPVAVSLPSGRTATSVSVSYVNSCAVLDDASVYCWGWNGYGQLGNGATSASNSNTPVAVSLPSGRTASLVDTGYLHTCAVLDDATLYCWGYNSQGQLGDGTNTNSNTPVRVSLPSGRTADSVASGGDSTCAILDDASAYCWGTNSYGLNGDGMTTNSNTPVAVSLPSGRTATSIANYGGHTCVILDDASLYCWGYNSNGELGDGSQSNSNTPVAVSLPSGRTASSVSTGAGRTCAVLDDASAYCWGANSYGQVGDGTTTERHTPVAVSLPSGRTATSLDAGNSHTCAVLDDASLYCWGYNNYGELGDDNSPTDSSTPVRVRLSGWPSAIAASYGHTCAVLDDAPLYCWGDNTYGQLGDGTTTDSSTPVTVSLLSGRTATSVSSSTFHTCAVLDDDSLYCWGSNTYGQLGVGTNTNSNTPVAVSLPSGRTAASVAAGYVHTCAVLDDASLYCWGGNTYGQLGIGSQSTSSTPVAVSLPSGRSASSVTVGNYHTCAVLDDASLYCWGRSNHGQLGDGTTDDSPTPVAVSLPSGRTAASVSSTNFHTCAILDNASLYCWGYNVHGEIGLPTSTTSSSTPVHVSLPSGRTASLVSAGYYHTCAVLDDASAYCWGRNIEGQLGIGSQSTSSTPVAVSLPSGRTTPSVSAGHQHSCAILDDYSLYCWGYNTDGQLGDGTTTSSSTPVATSLPSGRTVSVDSDLDGDGFTELIDDYPNNPARSISCSVGSYGRYVCLDSSAGHSAPTGSMYDVECSAGTYQPSTGQASCIDASAGYYVPSTASTSQTACAAGTYQPNAAQSSCIDASTRHYVDTTGSTTQTACAPGTYQPSSGQTTCITASAGNYVVNDGWTETIYNSPKQKISSGYRHTCAILDDGSVSCWGLNNYGQLGDGTESNSNSPNPTSSLGTGRTAVAISAGYQHTCVILDDGSVSCWGRNLNGEIGDGSTTTRNTPTQTSSLGTGRTAVAITAGDHHTCAILDNGIVKCWGDTTYGQVGSNTTTWGILTPTQTSSLGSGRTAVAISAGETYTCAVLDDGSISCWGRNDYGQLGDGTNVNRLTPTQTDSLGTGRTAVAISSGKAQSCAILDNGSVSCWGRNSDGEIGDGTTSTRNSPTPTSSLGTGRTAIAIDSGNYHVCAILDDKSVSCWGSNSYGQLGDGTNVNRLTPTQTSSLGTSRTATSISSGWYHTCSILDDASISCWGYNDFSQLGDGTTTDRNMPTQTSSLGSGRTAQINTFYHAHNATTQTACAAGTYQPDTGQTSCDDADAGYYVATTGSTTQTACAAGTYQPSTGQSSCTDASAGYYVPSTGSTTQTACAAGTYQPSTGQTSCTDASAGYYVPSTGSATQTACAAGTYQPSTGRSSCIDASAGYYVEDNSYTEIVYDSTQIAAGQYHTCAILDDGSVSCWGRNTYGQLGDGTTTDRNTPTQTSSLGVGRTAVAITAGYYHTCAILDDGSVSCWGRNTYGSLGDGTNTHRNTPTQTSSLGTGRTADAISAGEHHTCAILDDGSVTCWGRANSGQLGNGTTTDRNTPTQTSSLGTGRTAVAITAGGYHTCAILDNGSVSCWGHNYYGQLGDGTNTSQNTPSQTSSLGTGRTAVAITAGEYHTCAILDNGSVSCWGGNTYGQLGDGTTQLGGGTTYDRNTPTQTSSLGVGRTAVAITVGGYHTCAILDDGSVSCWGYNSAGQLGDGTTTNRNTPTQTSSLGTGRTAVAITGGVFHTCAILDNGLVSCWGDNPFGNLGIGTNTNRNTPTLTSSLGSGRTALINTIFHAHTGQTSQTACSAGTYQPSTGQSSCTDASAGYYVDTTGSTTQTACSAVTYNPNTASTSSSACIGASAGYYVQNNSYYEIDYNSHKISSGNSYSCVILDDGSVSCWGTNNQGQLGDGTQNNRSTPTQTSSLGVGRTAVAISAGYFHTCAILDDGSVSCWGTNNQGQLGDGTQNDRLTPTQTSSLGVGRTAVIISAGYYHTCAILDDGSVSCWGRNYHGQLGDGTQNDRLTPTQTSSLGVGRTAVAISAGSSHTCATLDNGYVSCWGNNAEGQLGDGTQNDRLTPTQTSSLGVGRTAAAISAGTDHTCAMLDNSSVSCWGKNTFGQLGDGTQNDRLTPTQTSSLGVGRTAVIISARYYHTCAILDNESVNCWGNNGEGQLGDGTSSGNTLTPTQTSSLGVGRTAAAISAGLDHTCAMLDNSSVSCWGSNYAGSLGDGTQTDRLTPTQTSSLGAGRTAAIATIFYQHTGQASQIPCAVGTYQPLTGQSSCDDASAGYYVDITASTTQTACPTGTYNSNNASTSSSDCTDASAGYYVGSTGSATQTPCPTGTYQPSTGQSSCVDASAGYYVGSTGSSSQTPCAVGTYQSLTGQSSCIDASAGNYVDITASTTQTPCSTGTYQLSTGQSSCIDASAGYYVDTTGSTNQTACDLGTFQNQTGQDSCTDASPGYYVDTTASTTQTACAVGTYQPSTGQSSCIDSSAGYYVDTTASSTQTACVAGTYQPSTGQSSCIDASAGYYVDTTGSTNQTACDLGTFQNQTGQDSCTDASPGYYVDTTASTTQTACAVGTYQPSTGQSSCIDSSAGYYVDTTASSTQTACVAGTYQPSTGQSSCIDASAGYYVGSTASTNQTACALGTYQPNTGQSSCIDASAGYYVDTTASTTQTACAAGTYQPSTGQSSCTDASAGYYVDSTGSATQTACEAGTYQANTGQPSCTDASAGYYVPSTASTSQTACAAGTYQPSTGQSSCTDASAGYYVDTTSSTTQTACAAGTYNSNTASTSSSACTDASAGYYVVATGSITQTACAAGTYQTSTGQSSCISAIAGSYANGTHEGEVLAIDGDSSSNHLCMIASRGNVVCWGSNNYGQLGDGTTTDRTPSTGFSFPSDAVDLGTGVNATDISVGHAHSCAIITNGSVMCWGYNYWGQLGDGTFNSRSTPGLVSSFGTGRTAISIESGQYHTCALLDNGSVSCWGRDNSGQLGRGFQSNTPSTTPVTVVNYYNFTEIAAGGSATCGILDNGSISCWGRQVASTGSALFGSTGIPELIANGSMGQAAVSISMSGDHTCAITLNGSLHCMGDNYHYELGFSDMQPRMSFTYMGVNQHGYISHTTMEDIGTCAVVDNTSTYCWGYGHTVSPSLVSQPWSTGSIVDISHSDNNVCAVFTVSRVSCWNDNTVENSQTAWTKVSGLQAEVDIPSILQTTCAAGSYQPSTGQSSCIDASAGYYVPSTGSTTQTVCAVGTYQPSTGQSSCIDASAGYYVGSTGSTTQTACAAGTYQPLTGQSSCTDASAGYYVDSTGSATQTACAAGTYQANTGQPSCTDASAGYYVPSTASTSQTACAAGTYQANTGQLSCSDASAGYYVDTTASTTQTACAAGTYQSSTGQSSCTDASAGYYVDSTGSATQTACAAGTYQANTGQPSCTDASAGYYVPSTASTSQTACAAGTYQANTGQPSCTDASAGYYVDTTASTTQTACAAGTYNSNTASTSSSACTDASAGNYVDSPGSATQTACVVGTYQPSTGQSSCTDASAGYYVGSTGSASQTACVAGTYQPSTGQSSCTDASVGYYVDITASTTETACAIGTYQPSTGQSSCIVASAGYYVSFIAATNQIACNSGTYQPSTGQSSCTDASAGYYVSNSASSAQTACSLGTYQPSSGQSSCIDATTGYYVNSTAATSQTACLPGTYQPSSGQTSCIDADVGHWVAGSGAGYQDACSVGTYQPSTGQSSCIDASAGYYVDATASTTQTACAAGTYQPSTGQSSCMDASAGYYVDTTASTTQTACSAGTYQPSTGQSSCSDASAGYYVPSTGSATQTACAAGTYQPSIGQSSCTDASVGYYVDTTASTTETACALGTYQPSTGQSFCIDASAGYYVDTTASTTQTACAAGTYNSNTASTSSSACIDASTGNYVDSPGSATQTACSAGTYQPSTGQSSCIDASAGYYVPSTGSATQTACAVGTYQSSTGQSSCIDASAGYYVDTTGSTAQTACAAGTYQPSTGQTSCIDASAGYYVDSTGSTNQTACGLGTYQPLTGQSSCIDASAGSYVPGTASTNQTACGAGTYQPLTGQSSCTDASAGYYVGSTGSASQTPCVAGTYQPSTGQSSCIDADPGYFVPISGSTNQTACSYGNYQPSSGQSSCIDASPGNYVNTNASIVQNPCIPGTYQPSSGQSSCLDSDAGYYIATSGSVDQTPCDVGTFQELEGQVSCVDASAGYYVNTTASTTQMACPLGSYQPLTGQTSCLLATPGHYVPLNGSSTQTPCLAGTYNPLNGSFSQGDCIQASTGNHVPNEGSASQIECLAGYFQNITGQSSCNPADPGYFVPNNASWFQSGCTYGTYQPSFGQVSCLDASPGHYVPRFASSTQTECDLGSYQPQSRETSCISASVGYYVDQQASTNQTSCPPGTSTTSTGSESVNDCYTDTDFDGIPDILDPDDDNDGYLDDLDAFPLDPNEWIDTDSDGIGNNADLDDDNDGWSDITEIDCGDSDPLNGTSTPADYDEDGVCNTLDDDDDNDSYPDSNDDFPLDECAILDTDMDGIPDWIFMNCNTNLSEDIDDDNDGYNDTNDSHPLDPSEWFDTDNDGIGNNEDTDDDGDNVPDQFDEFPLDSTEWMDTDGDGVGDNADTDNDDDGVLDTNDDFPNDANETTDTDGDGIGNNADDDDDGDGYLDIYDQFPLDSTEWFDTDLDGIGNNADPDDDGDGWTDNDEFICGSDELDANDVPDDSDGDGICDSEDDDSTGLAIIVDVISNPLVVGLFLLIGAIIIVTLFLQSRNQSSKINELERMVGDSTIIEDDDQFND